MTDFICDIDGTIFDGAHRLHHILKSPKDWTSFFAEVGDDKPIPHMIELIKKLHDVGDYNWGGPGNIIYVTGRSDECIEATEKCLKRHTCPPGPLYMRKQGDHRPDDIIKLEILEQIRKDGFNPILALDDRSRVVKAYRSAGLPCLQVAEGDF